MNDTPSLIGKHFQGRKLGWRPDVPDPRDYRYSPPAGVVAVLPDEHLLESYCPPVYDQGQVGSCTYNSIGGGWQTKCNIEGVPNFMPSRMFGYFNEREMEGTIDSDSGAQIRDGIKALATLGICPESMWPYDGSPFPGNPRLTLRPTPECYTAALKHRAIGYYRVFRDPGNPQAFHNALKSALFQGHPIPFGFTVCESFGQVADTGIMTVPEEGEKVAGGHATLKVGYTYRLKGFEGRLFYRVRNSWGPDWADHGYFWMPAEVVEREELSDDFWALTRVQ